VLFRSAGDVVMSIGLRRWLALAAVAVGLLAPSTILAEILADEKEGLEDARARLAIEAQRVEKEFADGRAAAYKLIRATTPDPVGAASRLHTLLAMLQADTSLEPKRREQLIVTLKWDLGKVKEMGDDQRRGSVGEELNRSIRTDLRKAEEDRRGADRKRTATEAENIITGRGKTVVDGRNRRRDYSERTVGVLRSVDEAAIPESRDYVLPKDWYEKSMRRSATAKMSAKEKALLKVLNTVIDVEFKDTTLSQVFEYLEKVTGASIPVDRRALEEVGATYDSTVSVRLKATTRTVLKRILSDFNLAYVIKDDQIQVTSLARAREMTTTRAYYIGDLASAVDVRLGPAITQLQMLENINRIITQITQQVDPQSWKVNNPEASGSIVFEPVTMSLLIKQTAEVHFSLGGIGR